MYKRTRPVKPLPESIEPPRPAGHERSSCGRSPQPEERVVATPCLRSKCSADWGRFDPVFGLRWAQTAVLEKHVVATWHQRSSEANALPIGPFSILFSVFVRPEPRCSKSMWSPPGTSVPPKQMLCRFGPIRSCFRPSLGPKPRCSKSMWLPPGASAAQKHVPYLVGLGSIPSGGCVGPGPMPPAGSPIWQERAASSIIGPERCGGASAEDRNGRSMLA